MDTSAATVVEAYYDALREGESLEPYFVDADSTTKFGISEALFGYGAVADALETQTETTADWTVKSERLAVREYGEYATMADEVVMAWTDTDDGSEKRFETRWSGTLVRRDAVSAENGRATEAGDDVPVWLFRTMHVSTVDEL
jgi:hypothetical protein